MDYQSERTKLGRFMYSLTIKGSKWLSKHMWLWYLLNLTWGIVYTLIGGFIALFLKLFFKAKFEKYQKVYCAMFGDNWGGLEGVFFIFVALNMGENWTEHTKKHEYGHSFQNAIFGVFNIFLTLIPSAIRYWYQRIRIKKGKSNKPYDLIWFEGSATDIGEYLSKDTNGKVL